MSRLLKRPLFAGVAGVLLASLAACGAAPELRLHSLLSGQTAEGGPAAAAAAAPLRVSVSPVSVPAALDQPQWLVRRADDTLLALEQDRWASPLRDEVRAALREGLVARWGVVDAGRAAAAPAGAPSASSWRVVVELLRLELRPGRDVLLEARWSLLPPAAGARAAECRYRQREAVAGEGVLPLAQAQRVAVGRLADDIGRQLRAMAAGAAPVCLGAPVS